MDLQANRPGAETRPRRIGWAVAAVLIALILALLAGFIFRQIETFPQRSVEAGVNGLERIGREARDQFVRLARLEPRVTVNNRVYLEQKTTVAELAVISHQIEVEHEMLHTWAGSTKRIRLHGTFLVKAGFDLQKKFSVNLQPQEIVIELPHAQLLSVEQRSVEVLALENGFWNRISTADLETELAVLPQLAREKSTGLSAEAEATFTHELFEKFRPPQPVRVIFPAPTPGG
jgi:hypothetical protein